MKANKLNTIKTILTTKIKKLHSVLFFNVKNILKNSI